MQIKQKETFYPDGKIHSRTYKNAKGKRHRDPKEGPAYERWYEDGHILCQEYWVDGRLHRDPKEGAAYTRRHTDGEISLQKYYVNGEKILAPKAEVEMIKPTETFYPNGEIKTRTYLNAEGRSHRDPTEGPAYTLWHQNGQNRLQEYWVDGKRHRDPKEGPAYTSWYTDGRIINQFYYVEGKMKEEIKPKETFYPDGKIHFRTYRNTKGNLHRDPKEGPAYEVWYDNGQLYYQQYLVDGKYHRDPKEGPAYTLWHSNGQLSSQRYYLDGKRVAAPKVEEEIKEIIKPIETFYPDGKIQSRDYRNAEGLFHRDPKEGPAYEYWYSNGKTYIQQYYVDGNLHRDPAEGPAAERWHYNGLIRSQQYYLDGKEVAAPKVEEVKTKEEIKPIEEFYSDGKIKSRTYLNADKKLHRDPKEGPAFETWYDNGQIAYQAYYVDEKLHRDPKEGPAYQEWYENGQPWIQSYRVDGKNHRDPKEGPAYTEWYQDGQICIQEYYVDNKLHRDPKEGAAYTKWKKSGEVAFQSYYVDGKEVPAPKVEVEMKEVIKPIETFYPDGKIQSRTYLNAKERLHRDPKDGPAYESWFSNGQIIRQEYCVDGKLHRDPKEGPALEAWYENGQINYQRYYVEGKIHRNPQEGAAHTRWVKSGKVFLQNYYIDGKEVPAPKIEVKMKEVIKPEETFYPDGKIQSRTYRNAKGKYHRDPKEGPAVECWHANGQIYSKEYHVDKNLHRDPKEGPAVERWYSNGQLYYQQYLVDGKSHRDPKEGPAYQDWYENGQPWIQSYRVDGRSHRDPTEGPAYTSWYTDGRIINQLYYVDGVRVAAPKVEEVKTKEEIKPIEEFYSDGKIKSRTYWNEEGDLHRDPKEGPAVERWRDNGQLDCQQYFVDNKLHRDPKEGAAYTRWYTDGEISLREYYVNGEKIRTTEEIFVKDKTIKDSRNDSYAKPIAISVFIAAILSIIKNNKDIKMKEQDVVTLNESHHKIDI